MFVGNDLSQNTIDGIEQRLKIKTDGCMDFKYGQLRIAASFTVKECGHQWALRTPPWLESKENRKLRGKIRTVVEQSASNQGKSTKAIWYKFRLHSLKKAGMYGSQGILKKISITSKLKAIEMDINSILKQANCEMQVICGKQWPQLIETEEDGIRFCGDCKKLVFYTKTSAELRIAAEKGVCVYIAPESNAEKANNRIRQIEKKALDKLKSGRLMGIPIIKNN